MNVMDAAMNTPTQAQPGVSRVAPIVMGRNGYLSVLLRLIGMDLYKVRRRLLSKVLLLVATLVIGGGFFVLGVAAIHDASLPATSYTPDSCARFPHNPHCINHPPALVDRQHEKQIELNGVALFLNMPGTWNAQERFIVEELVVLGVIMAGMLAGAEYSLGTVRLMFTRGPTRVQFLLAKIAVIAICAVPTVPFLILLGSGVGAAMAHLAGIGAGLSFLTAAVFGHFVLFVLLGMLFWFSYMLMAVFFGTVGRSTTAGVVGPLVWIFVEPALASVMAGLSGFAQHIPDYFLGTNLLSLIHDQEHALSIGATGAYPVGHSLLVVAAYLIAFVGVACWLTVRRDVTH